jgi:hypothetical protein
MHPEHATETQTALNLSFDAPGAIKPTGWKAIAQRPKLLAGASVGALLVLGLGISLFSSTPQSEVYEPEQAQLDKNAIVAGASDSHQSTVFQSTEQLTAFHAQLLSQEAQYYLLQAQKQVTESDKPCFSQSVHCALDQFQSDAVAQIEQARADRNWKVMLAALDRVQAIELARASTAPIEPEVNLSQLAIDNLVQSYKRYRGAEAESKAWEVQQQ